MRAAEREGERDVVGDWGAGERIRGVLAVPYIPVQGSPGVFRES